MKIKQLELKGFKSFRNQTRIRFEEGISCIVGPNGCGKSNIVDAFLWVMGESAPKHLRSKAMEDVIFAGAGGFPPSGRAEVSLIMERPKFSSSKSKEIMVTRRLNRDGLSEYLIDLKPARLKDVQEVFMDTGVGIHGFSFIEQGAIENFISSRPEQKKQMVEAVAGISRFRFRKKEAERKLNLTQDNLNRLQDLLSRQETDLKKLKKQSETAQKFKTLKSQIKKAEHELKAWDLKTIQEETTSITKEIKAEIQNQNKLKQEQKHLALKIQNLHKNRKQTREEQEKLRQENSILENQLISLEKELAGKKMALKIGQEQLSHSLKSPLHFENISSALKEIEKQIHQGEQEQEKLNTKWISLKKEEESLFTQVSNFQTEKEKLLKQISDKGLSQTLLEQTSNLLREKLKETTHILEQVKAKLRQKEEESKSLLSKQKALKEKWEKTQQISFDMSDLIEKEKLTTQALKEELQREREILKQIQEKEAVLYSEWQSLKKRKTLIEEGAKAKTFLLNTFTEGFLDTAQAIRLSSPFLEKAVSSFLSLRLNSLFVLKEEEVLQALKEVQQKNQGACRFILPFQLTAPSVTEKAEIAKTPGFQVFLEDQAQGDKELIKILFSEVAVVDNMATALALKKTYPAWCFITLSGEIISKEGDLIGLSFSNDETNILSWQKALKEVPLKYEQIKKLKIKTEEELRKKELLFQNLSNKMAKLNHEEHSFEIQSLEIKKDLESLNREHTLSLQEISQLEQEIKKIKNTQKNIETEQTTVIKKIEVLSQESLILKKNQEEIKSAENTRQTTKQALTTQKEQLWQTRLFSEKKLIGLKEHQKSLLKEREKIKQTEEASILKQKEQKTFILKEEKVLSQKEEEINTLKQKIKSKLKKINQLIKQEQSLESQKEQKEEEIQQARQKSAERDSVLNQLKLQKESLILKKQALIEGVENPGDKFWEEISFPVDFDRDKAEENVNKLNRAISRVGELNFLALKEYEELIKENEFYQKQYEDLTASKEKLLQVINRIDSFCSKKFKEVFEEIRGRFSKLWPILFEGGEADIVFSSNQGEEGLEIKVKPLGKKIQNMNLLSGGEKAMTAVAMMFSLFLVKPSPFCILDEVDAPLDDNNVTRFKALLSEMARLSQIILITHNKQSMKEANVLYGVTMEEKGISKIMSLKPTQKFNKEATV